MILDLDQFIRRERPFWDELERAVSRDADGGKLTEVAQVRRLHYLYERAASCLAKVQTFAAEPELRQYLEGLVGRAYAQLHRTHTRTTRWRPIHWVGTVFPRTFRRYIMAFWVSLGLSLLGAATGAFAVWKNPENKALLLPAQFAHLSQSPSDRVAEEEANAAEKSGGISGQAPAFSGMLMTHNTRVALTTLATGALAGLFTCVLLFYNGVILGFVGYDYIADGQGVFLAGWLLPHGVPELTAIFIGGQGGLVLARAVIGWGTGLSLRQRLRLVRDDLATLAGGLALMLVWAGIIEAFLSQYHGAALYPWKIGFGLVELALMVAYFAFSGRWSAKA